MKRRPLKKTFIYAIVSFGVYELIWLSATRKELVRLTGIRIPSVGWLIALSVFKIAASVLSIVILLSLFSMEGTSNVSSACWSEYIIGTAPETRDTIVLSDKCRSEVEQSSTASDRQGLLIKYYLMLIILLIISWIAYPRWLRNYATAVKQVTNGRLTQTNTMLTLVFAPYSLGLVFVQNIFNNISTAPPLHTNTFDAKAINPTPQEHETLRRILKIIAVTLGTLLLLLVLAIVLLSS